MTEAEIPEWVRYARKFIATGKGEFLVEAAEACSDPLVRAFLQRPETTKGAVNAEDWEPLVEQLKAHDRPVEAAVLSLIAISAFALSAESPELLSIEARVQAAVICNFAMQQSHGLGFVECDALFAGILGVYAMTQGLRHEARRCLVYASELYRGLAVSEPSAYCDHLARVLHNLGAVLTEERQFLEARRTLEEALGIRRSLMETDPPVHRPEVATTLTALAIVFASERDYLGARRALEEALDIRRSLGETTPDHSLQIANTLTNLGSVLLQARDFRAARRTLEKALGICRSLFETQPHLYRRDVAHTLIGLGNVLSATRDFTAARRVFEEAIEQYRVLTETEPHIYHPKIALALSNFATVLWRQRDLRAARGALEEALEVRRALAQTEPRTHVPDVALTLNNLGIVFHEEQDLSAARRALEEAIELYRTMAETEPHIYRRDEARALSNLGNVLKELGDEQLTLEVAQRAMEAAEDPSTEPDQLWLAKGEAAESYRRWLVYQISRNDRDRSFRCLAAMNEGQVRALGNDPGEGLDATVGALAVAGHQLGQQLRLLVARRLTDSESVLAVLDSEYQPCLQWHKGNGFHDAANKLFEEIVTVFDKNDNRNADERRSAAKRRAADAWASLPKPVRILLEPDGDHEVLISGDSYWTAFPWEALRYGEEEQDWLGLRRTLARWGPLTAGPIGKVTRHVFGDGVQTAAIVCPWNASRNRRKHLLFAKEEGDRVSSALRDEGYKLLPNGGALLGQAAQPAAMNEVLTNGTSLIHYTGHGTIIGNDEVLVLHGGDDKHLFSYFGRQETEALKNRLERERLLHHRPLVVLNSCWTGRTREFGGQREDLAWTFLAEGAEAVIASALPVNDVIGQVFGESLYSPFFVSSEGMGRTLVKVRRFVESATRYLKMWPAWTLLNYHGNPYALLPHARGREESSAISHSAGLLDRLAKWLGPRDASEVAEFIRRT